VIYFASPGGSFDELVQAVGTEFNLNGEEDVLVSLLEQQRQLGKKVLLIIDEAEKMFPAALERLLRAAFTAEAGRFQVILAGRPALNDHLAQLAMHCPDMDIETGHLLVPLSKEETGEYLAFRLKAAGMAAADSQAVFSAGAVRRLFEQAGGNLRLLHRLAEQALQQAGQELPVLAAHVPASDSPSEKKTAKAPLFNLGRVMKVATTGAAFLLLAALLVLYTNDEVRREEKNSNDQAMPAKIPPAAAKESESPTMAELENNAVKPVEIFPAAESEDILPPEPDSQQAEETPAKTAEAGQTAVAPLPSEPPVTQPSLPDVPDDSAKASAAQEQMSASSADILPVEPLYTPPIPDETETSEQQPTAALPLPEAQQQETKKVIQLAPGRKKTKPPEKKTDILPPQAPVSESAAASDPDRLYQELTTAGRRLKSRPHAGRYTIQLLTLASPDAAAQLKGMIARDEYVEQKDMLQILSGRTEPAGLFVFYGSYASMEEARVALDNMPLFLRKHHPYILPVDDALKKAAD
jgi:hypothetical protein